MFGKLDEKKEDERLLNYRASKMSWTMVGGGGYGQHGQYQVYEKYDHELVVDRGNISNQVATISRRTSCTTTTVYWRLSVL